MARKNIKKRNKLNHLKLFNLFNDFDLPVVLFFTLKIIE